jgi:uncharacterized protein (TIGR03437 family)
MRLSGVSTSLLVRMAFAAISGGTGLCATLSIPNQVAGAGDGIIAPVTLSSQGQAISSIQFDLLWEPAVAIQAATGSQVGLSSKVLYAAASGTNVLRFIVTGVNQGPISDGEILRVFIAVSPNAAPGVAHIALSNLVAAGPAGETVPIQSAPISIQIGSSSVAGALQPQGILSAASLLSGPVGPGEIVTLFGTFASGSAASSPPSLLFNGIPAPILYSGANQINAVVPFGIDLGGPVNVEVLSATRQIAQISAPTAMAAPAIFTQTATGTGPGAILNQDLTINSFSNPAPRDSIVTLFATGFGILNPPAIDGEPATSIATTLLPVTATVGGIAAEVTYAGAAPGLIAGAVQINVHIPKATAPDLSTPISLSIGSASTPAGVTVSIQ